MALDRGGVDPVLFPEPSVAAPEAGQIRDPGDLEPDEVDGVVHHALCVRLAEANSEVGGEAEVLHGPRELWQASGSRSKHNHRGGLRRDRLLPILFLTVTAMALAACSGGGDDSGTAGGDARGTRSGRLRGEPGPGLGWSGGGASGRDCPEGHGAAPGDRPSRSSRWPPSGSPSPARSTAPSTRHGRLPRPGGFVVSSSRSQGEKVMNGRSSCASRRATRTAMSRSVTSGGVGPGGERAGGLGRVRRPAIAEAPSRGRGTQLLVLLERAENVPAALAVQSKLNDTQLQLEETRGRLRYLDDQTSFATICVNLRERLPWPAGGTSWRDRRGMGRRGGGFADVAGRTFVAVATIAPSLLLGSLALVVGVRASAAGSCRPAVRECACSTACRLGIVSPNSERRGGMATKTRRKRTAAWLAAWQARAKRRSTGSWRSSAGTSA